ncbi:ATP-binding protein [Frankia canadensis]
MLHRIDRETALADGTGSALADMNAALTHLIPGVTDFTISQNRMREWEIWFTSDRDSSYSAAVASDGTLRVLALLAALYDPAFRGAICFEEPENGVHPARLRSLIQQLSALVTDQLSEDYLDGPLMQLILASHSPVVMSAVTSRSHDEHGCAVVFADMVTEIDQEHKRTRRRTRMRPVPDSAGQPFLEGLADGIVSESEVSRYAATAALEG